MGVYINTDCSRFGIFGAIIMFLIFLWDNIFFLVGSHYFLIAIISTACCTPTTFYLDFGKMRVLNLIGLSCNVIFGLSIFILFFYALGVGKTLEGLKEITEPKFTGVSNFSMSIGIFILSHAGHPSLPSVYNQVGNKESFNWALGVSFLTMFIIYFLTGFCGFLIYGNATATILTENIVAWPGGWFPAFVAFIVALRTFVSITPILGVPSELMEKFVFDIKEDRQK
eukprot:UN31819